MKQTNNRAVIFLGGHGDVSGMATSMMPPAPQVFTAGRVGGRNNRNRGDTESLRRLERSVIVAAGCHVGFNLPGR